MFSKGDFLSALDRRVQHADTTYCCPNRCHGYATDQLRHDEQMPMVADGACYMHAIDAFVFNVPDAPLHNLCEHVVRAFMWRLIVMEIGIFRIIDVSSHPCPDGSQQWSMTICARYRAHGLTFAGRLHPCVLRVAHNAFPTQTFTRRVTNVDVMEAAAAVQLLP